MPEMSTLCAICSNCRIVRLDRSPDWAEPLGGASKIQILNTSRREGSAAFKWLFEFELQNHMRGAACVCVSHSSSTA